MTASLIYKNAFIYEGLMRALYGSAYQARFQALADLIPDRGSVLDVCCGPATLFHRYLKQKGIRYTGLDINPTFIERLSASGGTGMVWNLDEDRPLPRTQYVIVQSSLYHFLPDAAPIVERMLAAAERKVLIAEPVRNVADSQSALLAFLARKLTNPGTGDQPHRFNEARLDALLQPYRQRGQVVESRLIAGGREKLYVLDAAFNGGRCGS
jgi:SAM-dependent methyltransferase